MNSSFHHHALQNTFTVFCQSSMIGQRAGRNQMVRDHCRPRVQDSKCRVVSHGPNWRMAHPFPSSTEQQWHYPHRLISKPCKAPKSISLEPPPLFQPLAVQYRSPQILVRQESTPAKIHPSLCRRSPSWRYLLWVMLPCVGL
jgi:hypothetical protein